MWSDTRSIGWLGRGVLALVALFVAFVVISTLVSLALNVLWAVLAALVPLVLFVAVAYALLSMYESGGSSGSDRQRTSKPPEERLKQRYVDGEIDEDEYERQLERYLDPVESGPTVETERSRERDFE